MDVDLDGPALNQEFLSLAAQSQSKGDFYRRLSANSRFKEINSSFTLMRRTASRDRSNASADYPRIIGFSGTLVLASVDHPKPNSEAQGKLVEGIAYASKSIELAGRELDAKKLHFFTLDFSTTPPRVDLQVESCQSCHAGRFNWETYNVWPGALAGKRHYTEQSEQHLISPAELRARMSMMLSKERRDDYFFNEAEGILHRGLDTVVPQLFSYASIRQDALLSRVAEALHYEGLEFSRRDEKWFEVIEKQRALEGAYAHLDFKSFSGSNRELNQFINSLTFDKIQHDLKKLPSFAKRKYAALAGVMGCGATPDFLAAETNALLGGYPRFEKIESEIREQMERQYRAKERTLLKYGDHESLNTADLEDVRRLAALRYLFEAEGFVLGEYSPNFFGRTDNLSYGFAHVGAGTFGANQLMCHLAPEIINENSEFATYFSDVKTVDSYRAPNEGQPVCEALKKLSLEKGI